LSLTLLSFSETRLLESLLETSVNSDLSQDVTAIRLYERGYVEILSRQRALDWALIRITDAGREALKKTRS
jgi:hypothetical protein